MALNDVPQAGQTLANTQPLIRTNFSVIDTAFTVDHVACNTAGQGKHNKVTFPVQGAAPVFAATEEGLYNKLVSGVAELFVHKQSLAGTKEIPFTQSILSTVTPTIGDGGWTYLPSGIHISWGYAITTVGGDGNYPLQFPPPTKLLSVLVTPNIPGASYVNLQVRLNGYPDNTSFQAFVSVNGYAAPGKFNFLAIGY